MCDEDMRPIYDGFYAKLEAAREAHKKRKEEEAKKEAERVARVKAEAAAKAQMADMEFQRGSLQDPEMRQRWVEYYDYFHELDQEGAQDRITEQKADELIKSCYKQRKEYAIEDAEISRDIRKIDALLAMIKEQNDFEDRVLQDVYAIQRGFWRGLLATVTGKSRRERRSITDIQLKQERRRVGEISKAKERRELSTRLNQVRRLTTKFTDEIKSIKAEREALGDTPLSRIFKDQKAKLDREYDDMDDQDMFFEFTFNRLRGLGLCGEQLKEEVLLAAARVGVDPSRFL